MGKKIEYTNGELTIIWQPELCQHAGICVNALFPVSISPKERPMDTDRERDNRGINCPNQAMSVWRVDIPNE